MTSKPDREDVVRLLGKISDHSIVEILGQNPSLSELEVVALYLAQENDVMGKAREPLAGRAARIHEIVVRDAAYMEPEDEDRAVRTKE